MRRVRGLFLVIAILALLVSGCVPVGPGESERERLIVVSGVGAASAAPDVAYVYLGIDALDADVAVAFEDATARMNAVFAVFEEAGIASRDIQTLQYNIWQEDYYPYPMMPEGPVPVEERIYHVENLVKVTVRDVSAVGDLVSMAFEAGANRADGISFAVEDTSELTALAEADALADARARAEMIATEMGVELGQLITVSESAQMPSTRMEMAAGIGGGGGMPISSGEFQVSAQVHVTYAIAE